MHICTSGALWRPARKHAYGSGAFGSGRCSPSATSQGGSAKHITFMWIKSGLQVVFK